MFNDAQRMLETIQSEGSLQCRAVLGFWRANSVGDDIELYDDNGASLETLRGLRQQVQKDSSSDDAYACLSDFIAPRDSGLHDHIGAFAVSCFGVEKMCEV